jgi:transcription elongation GreA/GreB family factor
MEIEPVRAEAFDKRHVIDKRELLLSILAQLERELELYGQSARAAHAEATHEQSKAENKYDTRGLEASYLAHGQSKQAAETEQARQQFTSLAIRDFAPGDAIDLGALVELELGKERSWYFVGPRAGGTEVEQNGTAVLIITPQSPLGAQLLGRKEGERLKIKVGGRQEAYRIARVA